MATNNQSQSLADLLVTRNLNPTYTDNKGRVCPAEDAKIFSFDWVASSGKDYGTAVILLAGDGDMKLLYGDNLGRGMDTDDKNEWYEFMHALKQWATRHDFTNFSPDNINKLKYYQQGMAAIKEGLFEGYYGNRKTSYMGEQQQARLVINHKRPLGENDARYRYVESLFIETAEGERYKLPFTKLSGGRAMLEHVRQGGRPYDVRGQHIAQIVTEMGVLARFRRASQGRVFEGNTGELVEHVTKYYSQLGEALRHMEHSRGYAKYFESWDPAEITETEALVEDLKSMFVETSIDSRIEQALPLLAKIQQGAVMKEAEIFESWANNLMEGTWSVPDTPEKQKQLVALLQGDEIVGPDATNITEQLYDILGDNELFDLLQDLAARDANAVWHEDPAVQARLIDLTSNPAVAAALSAAGYDSDADPADQYNMGNDQDTMEDFVPRAVGRAAGAKASAEPDLEKSTAGSKPEQASQADVRKADIAAAKQQEWEKALGAGSSIEEDQIEDLIVKGKMPRPQINPKTGLTPPTNPDYKPVDPRPTKLLPGGVPSPDEGAPPMDRRSSKRAQTQADDADQSLAEADIVDYISTLVDRMTGSRERTREANDNPIIPGKQGEPQEPIPPAPRNMTVPGAMARDTMEEDAGEPSPMEGAILRRIMNLHPELLRHGPNVVMQVAREVADDMVIMPDEEIGSSDISAAVNKVINILGGVNEADNTATFTTEMGVYGPVSEGHCNMTEAGTMCAVHGLEECWGQGVYESNELGRIMELAGIKKEENMNGMGHFAAMGEEETAQDREDAEQGAAMGKARYQSFRPPAGQIGTTQIPRQPEQTSTPAIKPMGSGAPDTSLLGPSRPITAADIKPFGFK